MKHLILTFIFTMSILIVCSACTPESESMPNQNPAAADNVSQPVSVTPSPGALTASPTVTPSPLPPTSTPTIDATRTAAFYGTATATAQEAQMRSFVENLLQEGKIDSAQGIYQRLPDYDQSAFQRGSFFWDYSGASPRNFILRADTNWLSADANSNWSLSGPGIVFHETDNKKLFAVFLRLNGKVDAYRLDLSAQTWSLLASGNIQGVVKEQGNAHLALVVYQQNIYFYVNDNLVLTAKDAQLTAHGYSTGRLDYAIASGSNKDFGLRVQFNHVELWELGEMQDIGTLTVTATPEVISTNIPDINTQKGIQAFENGNFQEAITYLSQAISQVQGYENPQGFVYRGRAYYASGSYLKAVEDYNRALKLSPTSAKIYLYRGYAYEKMKNNGRALADYAVAIKLDATDVWAFRSHGLLNASLKKFTDALQDYDHALQLDPNHAPSLNNRCWVLYQLKRYEDALKDCDQALTISTGEPNYLETRANVLMALDRNEDAVQDLQQILKLTQDQALIKKAQAMLNKLNVSPEPTARVTPQATIQATP